MTQYSYFDNAATTRCCEKASEALKLFAYDEFGNPSSPHVRGQAAAKAINEAREYFASYFQVNENQVIFTGSGTESDNLAILGSTRPHLETLIKNLKNGTKVLPPRVITSTIEHPAVTNAVESLESLGFEIVKLPVTQEGQVDENDLLDAVNDQTVLISIQRVNNIIGSILDVEHLATIAKEKNPNLIFHSDCIQAFAKVPVPSSSSKIDLVSISAHKIEGPKSIGALIVLNQEILTRNKLRPIVFGGGQEFGLRSGTQSPGLISAFHVAAKEAISSQRQRMESIRNLRNEFLKSLKSRNLIGGREAVFKVNSPPDGVANILSLSTYELPAGPLQRMLEERGCLVATGSACSSSKSNPDPVLTAIGNDRRKARWAIRVSFSSNNTLEEVNRLSNAIFDSVDAMTRLLTGA